MDQSGQVQTFQACGPPSVSIVGYNTGKNQSDCTNSLKCLRMIDTCLLLLQNDQLQALAEEAQNLKDEIDVLRHSSDKAVKYEATIETYKKKLEDLGDLKRQVKILEDKNTMYMQNTMELEEVCWAN